MRGESDEEVIMTSNEIWGLVRFLGLIGGIGFYIGLAAFAYKLYESIGVCQ